MYRAIAQIWEFPIGRQKSINYNRRQILNQVNTKRIARKSALRNLTERGGDTEKRMTRSSAWNITNHRKNRTRCTDRGADSRRCIFQTLAKAGVKDIYCGITNLEDPKTSTPLLPIRIIYFRGIKQTHL